MLIVFFQITDFFIATETIRSETGTTIVNFVLLFWSSTIIIL
jgi:hypothetical protein